MHSTLRYQKNDVLNNHAKEPFPSWWKAIALFGKTIPSKKWCRVIEKKDRKTKEKLFKLRSLMQHYRLRRHVCHATPKESKMIGCFECIALFHLHLFEFAFTNHFDFTILLSVELHFKVTNVSKHFAIIWDFLCCGCYIQKEKLYDFISF